MICDTRDLRTSLKLNQVAVCIDEPTQKVYCSEQGLFQITNTGTSLEFRPSLFEDKKWYIDEKDVNVMSDNEMKVKLEELNTKQIKIISIAVCVLWFVFVGGCTIVNA
ncbi:gp145 [Bacillus phage G]|uniref:Gp145 n=1 Tax=Bacillus phage G TaxID=2884420 RepID=G3MBL1_9CAUD|nr:gp145 [Bacillus phage G]AEO93407.1 gp145 [Bacillus phage G]